MRVMIAFLVVSIIFTSIMLTTQIYSIFTGLGAIERMRKDIDRLRDVKPVPIRHIFGDNWYFWFFPIPPYFNDPDMVLGYQWDRQISHRKPPSNNSV